MVMIIQCTVMQETEGDGVGRLFEATGAAPMINNCFTMLRCVCVCVLQVATCVIILLKHTHTQTHHTEKGAR